MSQPRKRWRLPLGTVLAGIVGAALAATVAIMHQGPQLGRRDLAVDMQQEFRKHGLHYTAVTAGAKDTVLRIEAPSMTRHFAEFLVRDPAKGERLGSFGFTAIVFANKDGGRWEYDIARRRFR